MTINTMKFEKINLSHIDLDKQSPVVIEKWLDINSEECKAMDPDPVLTKKFLKIGIESQFFFIDSLGRIWGGGADGTPYYPYHFEYGNNNYGFRIAAQAAN